MGFVIVNGSILDEEEYLSEVEALKEEAALAVRDCLKALGFEEEEVMVDKKTGLRVKFEFKLPRLKKA